MEMISALSFLGPRFGPSSLPKDVLQSFNLPCSEEALIAKARVNKTASSFSMIFPEKKKNPKVMLPIDLSSQTLGLFKSIVSLFEKYKLSSFCSPQFQLSKLCYFGG